MLPSCTRTEALEDRFGGYCFSVWSRQPASHLFGLFVRKAQVAVVVRFHFLHHVRDIGLAFERPRQHAIKDFLNLVSCHLITIAYLPDLRTVECLQAWCLPSRASPALVLSAAFIRNMVNHLFTTSDGGFDPLPNIPPRPRNGTLAPMPL